MSNGTASKQFSFIVCFNREAMVKNLASSLPISQRERYELIEIDNTNNRYSLPEALNKGALLAKGDFLIFCHQDIFFPDFWLDLLSQQIDLISDKDDQWGVAGIMGVSGSGFFAGHIQDPHTSKKFGQLPLKVCTLDEVCLIIRSNSGLRFDENMGGFHFYGTDICLQAKKRKMNCYAIDAPLTHLSSGKIDDSFWEMAERLKKKWSKTEKTANTVETTCGVFRLNDKLHSKFVQLLKIIRRKIIRRLQCRHDSRKKV